MFTVTCEKCGAGAQFDEAAIPPSGVVKKCPKCGRAMTVMPPSPGGIGQELDLDGFMPMSPPLGDARPPQPPPLPFAKGPALAAFEADGGDSLDLVDLPVPKGPTSTRSGLGDAPDLLMPVGPTSSKAPPPHKRTVMGMPIPELPDLLAPVGPTGTKGGVTNLPAPVGPRPTKGGQGGSQALDLLTPVGPQRSAVDLLTPVGPNPTKGQDVMDLPVPVGPVPTKNLPDLLTPVGPTSQRNQPDLLTPVGPTSQRNQPDLLTPVGPTSQRNQPDLLTPVGPTSQRNQPDLLTPVGPTSQRNQPDLLTPVGPTSQKNAPDLLAPKGFFDDIPQPKGPSSGGAPAPMQFDDLDLSPAGGTGMGANPFGPPPTTGAGQNMGGPQTHAGPPRVTSAIPALDLEIPEPGPSGGGGQSGGGSTPFTLDGLDLAPAGDGGKSGPKGATGTQTSMPDQMGNAGTADASVISFAKPAAAGGGRGGAAMLDLAESQAAGGKPKAATLAGDELTTDEPLDTKKKKVKKGAKEKAEESPQARRRKMIAVAVLGVVIAGGGAGFYVKSRMDAAKLLAKNIKTGLGEARKLLASDEPDHWDKAAGAAKKVLRLDGKNADALGLQAQAFLAAAIDDGQNVEDRRKSGDEPLNEAVKLSVDGVELDKAQALGQILDGKFDEAQAGLAGLAKKSKGDSDLSLYLGWAAMGNGDARTAKASFEATLAKQKDRLPALFGLGRAQVALGDTAAAKASFEKVLAKRTNHVGAWVGLASMLPRDRIGTREKRFMEIVNSEHAKSAHPRDLSQAWSFAGEEALRSRRLDDAEDRFKRAEELDRDNLEAIVGRGVAMLVKGNLTESRKLLEDVLRRQPGHFRALIGLTRLALAEGKHDQAKDTIAKALEIRADDSEAQLWLGKTFEADPTGGGLASAVEAYKKSMQLDPTNYEPVVALAQLYQNRMNRPQEATATLAVLANEAKTDPFLANTLGLAYLSAGDAAKAEEWFRQAILLEAGNVDAHANLGAALEARGNLAGAITEYETARKGDPSREDVALRLAIGYEKARRFPEAERVYLTLLDDSGGRKPTIAARAAAGRYYARRGDIAKASKLGESIYAEDPRHPAGLFLRGLQAYADGRYNDAQKLIGEAVAVDPQAQYYEAYGRAYEQSGALDDALAMFGHAIDRDKDYVEPLMDRARVRQLRAEWQEANRDLEAAKKLAPDIAEIYFRIGRGYFEMDDKKNAVPAFQQAIVKDPRYAEAYYMLGMTYYDLGDRLGEVVNNLEKAIALAPPDAEWLPEANLRLGYTLRTLGRKSEWCAVFRHYLNIAPSNAVGRNDVKQLIMSCP